MSRFPPEDKLDYNLSSTLYRMYRSKQPPMQEIEKDHPLYKESAPNSPDHRIISGLFKNPFGDITDEMYTFQGYGLCGDIEMKTMNCLEAYGIPQSFRKCQDYLEDLQECLTDLKRFERVKAMRFERNRQYLTGERKIKYSPPPVIGSFHY